MGIDHVRREFWGYTWPRAISRVGQIALQRLDILLVAAILGPADAALYTAATRFVVLGQFASSAIYRVLLPRFSALVRKGDIGTISDVFKISTAWSILVSWPLYLVAACAAPLYLKLFGSGYSAGAVPVVVTMAIAMMLAIASGPLDTLAPHGRQERGQPRDHVGLARHRRRGQPRPAPTSRDLRGCAGVGARRGHPQRARVLAAPPGDGGHAVESRRCDRHRRERGLLRRFHSSPSTQLGVLAFGSFVVAVGLGTLLYVAALWIWRDTLELTALRSLLPAKWSGARG